MASTFFITPLVLQSSRSRVGATNTPAKCKTTPRRVRFRMCSSTPSNSLPPSDNNNNNNDANKKKDNKDNSNNDDDHAILYGRFREFTLSHGNAKMQDDLVRQVLRQATHLTTSERMESTIQSHLDAVSESLSDMYSKSERDIEERNQRLTIETSLPNISKWNKQLIDGNKTSRQRRMEISKELELVDSLLKRTIRAQQRNRAGAKRRRRRHQRIQSSSSTTDVNNNNSTSMFSNNIFSVNSSSSSNGICPTSLNQDLIAHQAASAKNHVNSSSSSQISTPGGILFTIFVCTVAIESFNSITSREGGAERLVNYAALSTFLILSIAYLNALRSALTRAQKDLQQHTGSFRGQNRSDRL